MFQPSTSLSTQRSPRRVRRPVGFTLLEVMLGLGLFVIAGLGVMEVIGLINQNVSANRAMTAARLLVQAKIAKAQTDTFTLNNKVYPISCTDPSVSLDTLKQQGYTIITDPLDPDESQPVTIIGSSDTGPVITGTFTRTLGTFEAVSHAYLVTYTLTFNYRGKNYSVAQSTVRTPDLL